MQKLALYSHLSHSPSFSKFAFKIFEVIPSKNSKDCDKKAEKLKTAERWNQVRDHYLELKNQFINDTNHPSFICYVMAINEVYDLYY